MECCRLVMSAWTGVPGPESPVPPSQARQSTQSRPGGRSKSSLQSPSPPPLCPSNMERQDERDPLGQEPGQAPPPQEKRPYETPRVESVRLSKEAAEALT